MVKFFDIILPLLLLLLVTFIFVLKMGWVKLPQVDFSELKKPKDKEEEKARKKASKEKARENVLAGTHVYLARCLYDAIRYIICGLLVIFGLVMQNVALVMFAAFLFMLSTADRDFAGIRTPVAIVIGFIRKGEVVKKEEELYSSMALLQNLILQHEHKPVGALYLIEFLKRDANLTKNAYSKLIANLQMEKKQDAIDAFSEAVNSPNARDFAKLLVTLDEIPPNEMIESLVSRQDYMQQTSLTKAKKRAELGSDLIYIPVLFTVIIVIADMVYVGYASEMGEMFSFAM